MAKDSRIAGSFAPAYFHHCRSKSSTSRSRSLRPAAASRLGCAAASMRLSPRAPRWWCSCWCCWPMVRQAVCRVSLRDEFHRCHSLAARRRIPSDEDMTPSTPQSDRGAPTTRWGILATGKIARSFAETLQAPPGAVIAAVGSRTRESAAAFARDLGSPETHVHPSHAALVADPDVDVVYIASPHSHHLE